MASAITGRGGPGREVVDQLTRGLGGAVGVDHRHRLGLHNTPSAVGRSLSRQISQLSGAAPGEKKP